MFRPETYVMALLPCLDFLVSLHTDDDMQKLALLMIKKQVMRRLYDA